MEFPRSTTRRYLDLARPDGDPPRADDGTELNPPTPALVTLLQNLRGYPCVSLLLTTTPGPRMTPDDAARLHGLVREAGRRLALEDLPGVRGTFLEPLSDLVLRAARGPTSAAVAVFVSEAVTDVVHLPLPVDDRVVVDPSFATRDLVRSLHRTPRHVVLALGRTQARLFDGLGDGLRPARAASFPRTAHGSPAGPTHPRRAPGPEQQRAFLRGVDAALGAYLRRSPAPLVLVGTDRVLAEFRRVSRNTAWLAGCVRGNLVTVPLRELAPRIRAVLDGYLRSRQDDALAVLERRASAGRVASGISAAWLAARYEMVEMLAVEEGYRYPARVDADGDLLAPATDVDHPEVLDDAVDELIEAVLRRGGWIAPVADGALADHDRVALTLRG